MTGYERAYWLADKIPACGDYAKEAAELLKKQADEIEKLQNFVRRMSSEDPMPTPRGTENVIQFRTCGAGLQYRTWELWIDEETGVVSARKVFRPETEKRVQGWDIEWTEWLDVPRTGQPK